MQVLKEEVQSRIFDAAVQVFYEKDFRSAKMQDIAACADVSVGLLYSYFENKERLFEEVASSLDIDFDQLARAEERHPQGNPSDRFRDITQERLLDLLERHELLVIVMDKGAGTSYEHAKDEFIASIERHIRRMLDKRSERRYPDLLAHVLASNFAESLMEVARHYRSREEARQMLDLVVQCYYEGVNSL